MRDEGNGPTPGIAAVAARYPLALVAIGVALYSTGPVFVQASTLSGPVFSLWRLWIGFALMGAIAFLQSRRSALRLSRRGVLWMLGGGVSFAIHQVLIMTAVKLTSVADVVLMNCIGPIVVAIVAIPLFGERPGPTFRLWSALAIVGAAGVAFGGATGPQGDPLGMAMAAGNVVFFAFFFLFSKVSRADVPVVPFLAGVLGFAAITVSAVNLVIGDPVPVPTGANLVYVLAVTVGPGALGHFVMTWPLKWVRANVPPVMRMAQPFLAGLLAWAWLGEPITLVHVIGGATTIAGASGAVLSRSGRAFAVDRSAPRPG